MADPETPVRSYMDDPGIQWRHGKPNYNLANLNYLKGKTQSHPVDSLEKLVENMVKTWEMESTHKNRPEDWKVIDRSKYKFVVNGGRPLTLEDNINMGNYNMMMIETPLYDHEAETHDSSHTLFKRAFTHGFTWELLELFSGPPKVSFTWRHWTNWKGPYKNNAPTGEKIEMIGSCVVVVNEDLKVQEIQVYFDANPLMLKLLKGSNDKCTVCSLLKK